MVGEIFCEFQTSHWYDVINLLMLLLVIYELVTLRSPQDYNKIKLPQWD